MFSNLKKLKKPLKIFCVSAGFFLIYTAGSLTVQAACITATACPSGSFQALPGSCTAPQIDCIARPGSTSGGTDSGAGGVREGLGEAKAGLPEFTIEEKIGDIISTILGFVGILFLVLMIAGGLMWMTAGGSEDKLGKAKKLITSAVVGMIIVFSAYAITYFVTETLLGR